MMGKKKVLMSVTASAIVASGFIATDTVDASSYKVQSGDTLWSIANDHNLSLIELKTLNNLSTDSIQPNQVIKVATDKSAKSTNNTETRKESELHNKTNSTSTYTVQAGDTLSQISRKYNVTINDLIAWNNLDSTLIFPGNVLSVSKDNATSNGNTINNNNQTNDNQVTYTVKSGDTLAKIAQQYKTTVTKLKEWNNLNSDLIRTGQRLSVQANNNINTDELKNSNQVETNDNKATYIVKSGDTLSRIANSYNITIQDLKKWNNLTTDKIHIGQKINIQASNISNKQPNLDDTNTQTNTSYDVNQLLSASHSAIGTNYTWGGQTLNGFDCSGFLYWAYNEAGMSVNRLSTDGYYNRSYYVNNPQVGDLVFFKDTYRSGISHAGIYIGNNEFIHAGTSTGVAIANLDNSYWKKHYDGFKRFY